MNLKMPNQDNYDADIKFGMDSEAKTLAILKVALGEHMRKSKKQYAIIVFSYHSSRIILVSITAS